MPPELHLFARGREINLAAFQRQNLFSWERKKLDDSILLLLSCNVCQHLLDYTYVLICGVAAGKLLECQSGVPSADNLPSANKTHDCADQTVDIVSGGNKFLDGNVDRESDNPIEFHDTAVEQEAHQQPAAA